MIKYFFYKIAKWYMYQYEGFSYKLRSNGEKFLLKKIALIDPSIIFDVGCNKGEWTIIASDLCPKSTIHCFEISKSTFDLTTKNLRSNPNTILNNCGLSNESGTFKYLDFGINSEYNSMGLDSSFLNKEKSELKDALVISGDDYCKMNNISKIDLLKIDVEGWEYKVLEGFSRMLNEKRITVIQFEYGYTNADNYHLMKDFYNLLEGYGYIIGPLKPKGVIFSKFHYKYNDFNSGPNFVAVQKSEEFIISNLNGPKIKGFNED